MITVDEGLYIIDHKHDLVFSEDDESETGKGWYIQKDRKTSQLFERKSDALHAFKLGELIYT